jgi:hypothetical protein
MEDTKLHERAALDRKTFAQEPIYEFTTTTPAL